MPQPIPLVDMVPKEVVLTSDSMGSSVVYLEHYPRRLPKVRDWSEFVFVSEPGTVLLHRLSVTGRKLRFPLYLMVEHIEEGDVLVSDLLMHLYGVGTTVEEALADYEAMLLEHHEHLVENAFRLAPRLQRQLRYLDLLLA